MSQENVELVRRLQPAPNVDIAQLIRDDATSDAFWQVAGPYFHPDLKVVGTSGLDEGVAGTGLSGLREAWLDWLAPWESYRSEVEDLIDAGDQVVVLVRDYGRRTGMDAEVALSGGSVYTVREGKIARVEFCANRADALEAAGLSGQAMSRGRRPRHRRGGAV